MDKVCFVIGEGRSERYFLSSLLEHQCGFSEPEYVKGGFIYKKGDIFWILNSPPDICARTGRSRVISSETYTSLRGHEYAHRHCFSEPYEPHYLVIRDGDTASPEVRDGMISEIVNVSKPILKKDPIVHLPTGTIENWFFSGLNEDFEHFKKTESVRIAGLINGDVENLQKAKDVLDSVVVDRLSKQRKIIGDEVGAVFDIDKAVGISSTFNDFWTELREIGLV